MKKLRDLYPIVGYQLHIYLVLTFIINPLPSYINYSHRTPHPRLQ